MPSTSTGATSGPADDVEGPADDVEGPAAGSALSTLLG